MHSEVFGTKSIKYLYNNKKRTRKKPVQICRLYA